MIALVILPCVAYYVWLWRLVRTASSAQRQLAAALALALVLGLAWLFAYYSASDDFLVRDIGYALIVLIGPPIIATSICGVLVAILPENATRQRILNPALVIAPVTPVILFVTGSALYRAWVPASWLWGQSQLGAIALLHVVVLTIIIIVVTLTHLHRRTVRA